jgi:hypothetical protein
MKNLSVLMALLISLTTYGCSFKPHLGMSFEKWDKQCASINYQGGYLVEAEGNLEVYNCETRDVFFYFRGGILIKMDQGQLYKERIEVEIKE